MVQLEHFELEDGPRKAMLMNSRQGEKKNLVQKVGNFLVLSLGQKRTKTDTEAAEHKIEVTDPKPFKERPRNIPSGLLEEVKDHLDHMGAIKPSKLAWSNAVVLVQKKDGGPRFCINF